MSEIVAIVEVETEQAFVRNQLAAHLGSRGIAIRAVLSGKTRKHGGVKRWESARNDIVRTLKERRYCTTMFDFYAMPGDWPGRTNASDLPWDQRGAHVEAAILRDLVAHVGESFNPSQFIPYVQVHEFEALMFADVQTLAEVCLPLCERPFASLEPEFREILDTSGNAEAINDGYETCPSRRIMKLARGYRKRAHSPIVAQRIGLEALRSACRHFASWVEKLETLERTA